jgi:hypothetical protein
LSLPVANALESYSLSRICFEMTRQATMPSVDIGQFSIISVQKCSTKLRNIIWNTLRSNLLTSVTWCQKVAPKVAIILAKSSIGKNLTSEVGTTKKRKM